MAVCTQRRFAILNPTTCYWSAHAIVLIIHEVEAYAAWKAIFDQAADIRQRAGEISYQLLRYDKDANKIAHFSEWSSVDNARRFFESDELVDIRKKAGVKAPEFIYLQEIERGVL